MEVGEVVSPIYDLLPLVLKMQRANEVTSKDKLTVLQGFVKQWILSY